MADLLARTDSRAGVVKAARAARDLIPHDENPITGPRASDRVARLISESRPEKPSAIRELGLASIQVWQALVTTRRRRSDRTPVPATILFTDLVGFSTWSLSAGDEATLRLLRRVAQVTEPPLLARDGGFVAAGHDADLDETRALRDEGRGVIGRMQADYAAETGIAGKT